MSDNAPLAKWYTTPVALHQIQVEHCTARHISWHFPLNLQALQQQADIQALRAMQDNKLYCMHTMHATALEKRAQLPQPSHSLMLVLDCLEAHPHLLDEAGGFCQVVIHRLQAGGLQEERLQRIGTLQGGT